MISRTGGENAVYGGRLAIAIALIACVPSTAYAGELREETLKAWKNYIQTATACMRERLQPNRSFLWTDEHPEIAQQVRAGAIVTVPISPHTPTHVPFGMIHHWIGAVFVPNASLEDVFAVIRDYDRYKDYYHPAVQVSKAIRQNGAQDQFSMLLMGRPLLANMAFDSDYHSTYVQVDSRRWYSVSSTTRVQEVEEYGQPEEHKLPPGHGHGYVWRLYSITRFEQREDGVLIELEAMALSRDIPAAVRWLVQPIVRRLSKDSLATTLRQTQQAVGLEAAAAARHAPAQPAPYHP